MHKTGEILMGLRESAGISLEEVSNDINIPVIALEQIEAGTLGSFEDIYELANSRNKVFFKLLQNEFKTEDNDWKSAKILT